MGNVVIFGVEWISATFYQTKNLGTMQTNVLKIIGSNRWWGDNRKAAKKIIKYRFHIFANNKTYAYGKQELTFEKVLFIYHLKDEKIWRVVTAINKVILIKRFLKVL